MENKLFEYDEVLKQTDEKRHLLLGNGFSMAYDKNRFSFTSLLQSAIDNGIIEENSNIHKIFKNNNTSDFEEVVKILENTSKILKIYTQDERLCEQLSNDSEKLKNFLVDIITNNHPNKIQNQKKLNSTAQFIENYQKIFTLNYDLLLYWVIHKIMQNRKDFKDGFGGNDGEYVVFDESKKDITCFYLHGALHIFDNGNKIIKKTYSRTKKPLKEQITEELNNNRYPVFVSEGTSEQKKAKIIHNAYLNHCYKSLSYIDGDLIVFGTMLKSNDEHIQDAILKSKVKNIYFGVSSLEKGKNDLNSFIEKIII
ncbi:DUF4917 family protein [Campylobacter jejuni]